MPNDYGDEDDIDDEERRAWFDMEQFRKSKRYIGPDVTKPTKRVYLADLDIDRRPAPSDQHCSASEWTLAVRGWGHLVISKTGVRLLRRAELTSSVVEALGHPYI